MKELKFEWYVMNECEPDNPGVTTNNSDIHPFNIFCNHWVNKRTNELCREYKKKKMTFQDFTNKLAKIIMCEEWSRTEYEICVTNWPPRYRNKEGKIISVYYGQEHEPIDSIDMWKIDCYEQVLPNIKIVAKYVLEEYYPRLKINLDTPTLM